MSYVNADTNVIIQSMNNIKMAIDSLNATKNSINSRYSQLGDNWNDKHYKELGVVIQDCNKAINSALKTLLQGEKYLLQLYKYLKEYENTNFNLSNSFNGNYQSNNNINKSLPTQNTHRPSVGSREAQIQTIINDIGAYTGQTVSSEHAKNMLDSLHDYSGTHYSEIRYAYNNGNAPERLVSQLRLLDEYINSVPKWEGRIYRGINVSRNTAEHILSQTNVDMLGPSSWSSAETVAQRFARGSEAVHIVFVLNDNHCGASITHLATYNGSEEEVLAPSGVQYTIDNVQQISVNGEEYYYVDVHDN